MLALEVVGSAAPAGDGARAGRRPSSSTRSTPASAGGPPSTSGARLAALAEHAQVIVVTHLAQVAAFADRHLVVHKSDDGRDHLEQRVRRRG